jgi:hypothetical protein
LPRKYSGLKRRQQDEKDDTERVYSTNEGDVLLTLVGNRVFIGEGFDLALSRKLRDAIDAGQGSGPVMQASSGSSSLVGGLSKWVGSFGMMRAAMVR